MSTIEQEIIELINNFFLKAALLLQQSKDQTAFDSDEPNGVADHLFNIDTRGDPSLELQIQPWITFDGKKSLPPLVLETYLDLRRLQSNHSVYLLDVEGNQWMVCKGNKKSEIVLERWLIELDTESPDDSPDSSQPEAIHKQLVLLFRYLYTLTQLLPSNDLFSKLINSQQPTLVNINTRFMDGSKPILSKGRVGLSKAIIASYSNIINETNIASHLEQRKITPIKTKFGSLRITVSYRKDTAFFITDLEDYHKRPVVTAMSNDSQAMRRTSTNGNRSISISPRTSAHSPSYFAADTISPRRQSISAKLQPFKVGSVGSGSYVQTGSIHGMNSVIPSVSRNASSSSVVATLRVQRGSAGSTVQTSELPPELSSVGSGSKYSSSFGRIRRHSSIRRSESIDRGSKPKKSNERPSEDLLEFMKMLEDKKDLTMKGGGPLQPDISSSLLRFQSMKPNNETLSDDLSMSMSMDQTNTRFRSNSHSPIPSFSPQYGSIPSRLSHGSRNNSNTELATSRKSSVGRRRHSASSRNEGEIDGAGRNSIGTIGFREENENELLETNVDSLKNNDVEDEDEDEHLMKRSRAGTASNLEQFSTSPRSVRSISTSSYARSQLPLKPPNFSHPTTSATTTHAKFHKSMINHEQLHQTSSQQPHTSSHKTEDEDDLLFVMSDMNLTN